MPPLGEFSHPFELTVHGYVMGLRRVRGDDGTPSQTLRWVIKDKEETLWDVYAVIEPNQEDTYYAREMTAEGQPKDLTVGWEDLFSKCSPYGPRPSP